MTRKIQQHLNRQEIVTYFNFKTFKHPQIAIR